MCRRGAQSFARSSIAHSVQSLTLSPTRSGVGPKCEAAMMCGCLSLTCSSKFDPPVLTLIGLVEKEKSQTVLEGGDPDQVLELD